MTEDSDGPQGPMIEQLKKVRKKCGSWELVASSDIPAFLVYVSREQLGLIVQEVCGLLAGFDVLNDVVLETTIDLTLPDTIKGLDTYQVGHVRAARVLRDRWFNGALSENDRKLEELRKRHVDVGSHNNLQVTYEKRVLGIVAETVLYRHAKAQETVLKAQTTSQASEDTEFDHDDLDTLVYLLDNLAASLRMNDPRPWIDVAAAQSLKRNAGHVLAGTPVVDLDYDECLTTCKVLIYRPLLYSGALASQLHRLLALQLRGQEPPLTLLRACMDSVVLDEPDTLRTTFDSLPHDLKRAIESHRTFGQFESPMEDDDLCLRFGSQLISNWQGKATTERYLRAALWCHFGCQHDYVTTVAQPALRHEYCIVRSARRNAEALSRLTWLLMSGDLSSEVIFASCSELTELKAVWPSVPMRADPPDLGAVVLRACLTPITGLPLPPHPAQGPLPRPPSPSKLGSMFPHSSAAD